MCFVRWDATLCTPTSPTLLSSALWGTRYQAMAQSGNGRVMRVTPDGTYTTYASNRVMRIAPDGTSTVFFESEALLRPQGLALVGDYLYVSDFNGLILKIHTETREHTVLAEAGVNLGNMVYKGTNLYVTALPKHQIYQVSLLDGSTSVFAGSGELGTRDGTRLEAQFVRPLGLAFNADKSIL